jgi:hypothetical protein
LPTVGILGSPVGMKRAGAVSVPSPEDAVSAAKPLESPTPSSPALGLP